MGKWGKKIPKHNSRLKLSALLNMQVTIYYQGEKKAAFLHSFTH